jgi:hypothetical protein
MSELVVLFLVIMKNMNIKKNISVISAVLLSLFIFAGIFTVNVNTVSADCTLTYDQATNDYRAGRIKITIAKADANNATAVVENNTDCTFPAETASFKVYDNKISGGIPQSLIAVTNYNIPAHSSYTFVIAIAPCLSQVDTYYYGPGVPTDRYEWLGKIFGTDGRVFNNIPSADGQFCTNTPPPPPPPPPPTPEDLAGSCSVNPSSVNVGGTLNWTATASGATGSYTYSWSGTDSLVGNSNSVSKVYPNAGTKTGTVTITSGTQSITRTCTGVVNENIVNDDLVVSCSASPSSVDIDEDVTWRANATGGTGSYSYDWSGTDGLDGSSRYITWSYDDNGTKRGTVTVTSGSESASASCTVSVDEEEVFDDLNVRCYASPSNPQIGSRMNWFARVEGGDGDYDYDWSGSEGLNSSSRSPYMTYDTPGSKRATVTVTDGQGNEDTATCYANINSVLAFSQTNQPLLLDAVYLNQVPYTGFADNMKLYFFVGMLALFSAWIASIIISRQSQSEA